MKQNDDLIIICVRSNMLENSVLKSMFFNLKENGANKLESVIKNRVFMSYSDS